MKRVDYLHAYYEAMLGYFGHSHWWPGESPFEIAVGAILTQNTSWNNVEKALVLLREQEALSPAGMDRLSLAELERCLYPSGFYRVKARRMRAFLDFLAETDQDKAPVSADLDTLGAWSTPALRERLLQVQGIGPETADSILLYALQRPVFVVDAYTRRIYNRHGFVPEDVPYDELQEFFTDVLSEDVAMYNEYHALIVRVGKEFCKKNAPLCQQCPLGEFLDGCVE